MRTLFIVTVFLCTGLKSYAQNNGPEKQVITIEKGSTLTPKLPLRLEIHGMYVYKSRRRIKNNAVSIYKFKNTKVKRALAFMTVNNRPVLV